MTDSGLGDGLDDVERTYRRRKTIGTVLAVVVVAGCGIAAWMYLLRNPSPRSVCSSLYGLVEGTDVEGDDAAVSLASRVAPQSLGADEPEAAFRETCEVFFGPLKTDRMYPKVARCLTTSWSAEAAQTCFSSRWLTDGGDEAVREYLATRPVTFPDRAPDLPEGVADAYPALVELSVEALAKCDALYDAERGCYTYTWAAAEAPTESE